MATLEELNAAKVEGDHSLRRRDLINIAAVSFAGVGAVAVALPLINQMNPPADVLALASTEVDISKIAPGQAIKTSWRKQPVFVRNLTPAEIASAKAVPLSELRDPPFGLHIINRQRVVRRDDGSCVLVSEYQNEIAVETRRREDVGETTSPSRLF